MKAATPIIMFLLLGLLLIPRILVLWGTARDPYAISMTVRLQAPSVEHPFGTDTLGRDHLARVLVATGRSLSGTGVAFGIALFLALTLGTLAGCMAGRWPDDAVSYLIALIYTVPFILLAVGLATVLKVGVTGIYTIVGCLVWAPAARLVRTEVLRVRNSRFVTAERALGLGAWTVFRRSYLPLSITPALVCLLYLMPEMVGLDVGLSFFGLGAQPPNPTLGRLIYDGLSYLRSGWWVSFFPVVVLLVFFFSLFVVMKKAKLTGRVDA